MDQAVSNSVLRGRPFGGVGIFLNNNLRSSVLHHIEGDRFVIVVLVNVILISVYMPAIKSSNDSLTILSMLAEIESCISVYSNLPILCGGDCNCDLRDTLSVPSSIKNFISSLNLVVCDHFSASNKSLTYSYHHEGLGHQSCIDYFLTSDDIKNRICECIIFDHALNLSDHLPVKLSIFIDKPVSVPKGNDNENGQNHNRSFQKILRWDHADISAYYNETLVLFSDIRQDISSVIMMLTQF